MVRGKLEIAGSNPIQGSLALVDCFECLCLALYLLHNISCICVTGHHVVPLQDDC